MVCFGSKPKDIRFPENKCQVPTREKVFEDQIKNLKLTYDDYNTLQNQNKLIKSIKNQSEYKKGFNRTEAKNKDITSKDLVKNPGPGTYFEDAEELMIKNRNYSAFGSKNDRGLIPRTKKGILSIFIN